MNIKPLSKGFYLLLLISIAQMAIANEFKHLINQSDAIGLVQVIDVDYEYVRGFPQKGHAILEVLVAYKGFDTGDLIQVIEEKRSDLACFYPDRKNEGHRFIAFLSLVKEKNEGISGVYKGEKPSCQLPVFITDNSSYALLYPIAGINIKNSEIVRQLNFIDPHAYIEKQPLTTEKINHYKTYFKTLDLGDRLRYSQGILLQDFRKFFLRDINDTSNNSEVATP